MNEAVPVELVVPLAAEGVVVNAIELLPLVIEPPVVEMPKLRLVSPVRLNASAAPLEPGAMPTSPVAVAVPPLVTTIVPPVPVVNLPKLSDEPDVWVSTIGAMIVAEADPVAVEVLPDAAWATDILATAATIAAVARIRVLNMMVTSSLCEGPDVPSLVAPKQVAGRPAGHEKWPRPTNWLQNRLLSEYG